MKDLAEIKTALIKKRDALSGAIFAIEQAMALDVPDSPQKKESDAPPAKEPTTRPTPRKKRFKAPKGTLLNAVFSTLTKEPQTNRQIRSSLKTSKYKYSYNSEKVRQVLAQLRDEKRIFVDGEGMDTRYSLPK